SLGSQFTVTVFNSNSHPRSTVIRIPFYGTNVSVTGPKGESVDVQVIKTFRGTSQLKSTETAPYELLLPAEIPAFGFATYFVVGKR
ncbi:unnamed protein product, partial [Anisakis simplex]|uniref:Transglut_C domain-containing protein n=1 Tax=Anisakis simplex TaxID=6269 RepID=A0A0M3JNH6_ANISI